jgi:hypothetical protein
MISPFLNYTALFVFEFVAPCDMLPNVGHKESHDAELVLRLSDFLVHHLAYRWWRKSHLRSLVMKRRSPQAKALSLPIYRQRVVKSRKAYNRKAKHKKRESA